MEFLSRLLTKQELMQMRAQFTHEAVTGFNVLSVLCD